MPLIAGTRLGSYEIVGALGAGGMGEVYRATDVNLKRQVAVKILPPDLAADINRLARFQREAEVLASLNHPHIAQIYGFEQSSSIKALVMELVEGPTLAERLEKGPIPIDEALAIARQIAEALEAAHEQGIVHRDLKPANIKVRDDGTVKVLDFGLAKGREAPGSSSSIDLTIDTANSPTIAPAAMSQAGVILGTAAYMSPEQARGRVVDKRTDVWAFGAVLYEMLTGSRAFEGEDVTELMAAVVKSTPNWALLPADVPPQIVTLIKRCLEKDLKARIGDIAVARFLLSGDAAIAVPTPAATLAPAGSTSRWGIPAALAVVVALGVGALLGWLLPKRAGGATTSALTHLQMSLQPADFMSLSTYGGQRPARMSLALSPDGRRVVFVGSTGKLDRFEPSQLYLRDLTQAEATPIPGTDFATAPFFSPDSAWIGFVADNKIKKLATAGGPITVICDLPTGAFWGGSWAEDGTIFFAARPGLFKVSSAGGTPVALTTVDTTKGERHLLPQPLPGGTAVLFTSPPNVVLLSLDTHEQRTLFEGTDARYVETGHLLYMKTGTLMAVPFDPRAGKVTAAAVALIEGVMHGVNAGNGNDETEAGQFALSASGTLVYALGGIVPNIHETLTWVDRKGTPQLVSGVPVGTYQNPDLSPDGQKIVVSLKSEAQSWTGARDLWVYDAQRSSMTRLTFDGGVSPLWSPDGKRIVYTSYKDGPGNLYVINADGSGKPERLTTNTVLQTASTWAAGINAVAFMQRPTPQTFGVWVLPMDAGVERTPRLFLDSQFVATYPELSPDGHWMAYVSTESGANEVYVQPYPGPGEKIRISMSGGSEPIWLSNGKELLYRSGTRTAQQFLAVTIRSVSPFRSDPPQVMFEAPPGSYDQTTPRRAWDATADGQRLLLMKMLDVVDKPVSTLQVVLNWTDELRRRVPIK